MRGLGADLPKDDNFHIRKSTADQRPIAEKIASNDARYRVRWIGGHLGQELTIHRSIKGHGIISPDQQTTVIGGPYIPNDAAGLIINDNASRDLLKF